MIFKKDKNNLFLVKNQSTSKKIKRINDRTEKNHKVSNV